MKDEACFEGWQEERSQIFKVCCKFPWVSYRVIWWFCFLVQFLCSSQSTQVVTCIISLPFTTVRSLLLFTVYLLISSILEYTECSYRTAYMYHYKKQTYLKVELLNFFWGACISLHSHQQYILGNMLFVFFW